MTCAVGRVMLTVMQKPRANQVLWPSNNVNVVMLVSLAAASNAH